MNISLKHVLVVAAVALAVVGCTTVQAAPPVEQQSAPAAEPGVVRHITVVGRGQVSLTPDVATVNVGAEATAATVSEAKEAVDQRIAAIAATLKEHGIADKDIQTSSYNIYFERQPFSPVMREGTEPETQGTYRVSSMLRVTVRDIDKVGAVLDAVVESGANQVYGVYFTVDDASEWESEARAAAIADAKARAEELASLSGVKLGQVLTVSEVVGDTPEPLPMLAVERAAGGAGIAPGELEMGTQVQVTFAIE